VRDISTPESGLSLVAECDGQIVGHLGLRKASLRIPDGAFQAIRLPEYEPWMTGTLVYAEPFWRHDAVGLRTPDA
jgi:putative acetyltransferase